MFFRKSPAPPPPPQHSLTFKVWPPEASAHGLGIVGLIAIILIVVLASAFGVPAAKAVIAATTRPAQVMLSPATRPPD